MPHKDEKPPEEDGYRFLTFEKIKPVDHTSVEPIPTDLTCEEVLRESIYDLIRLGKEAGMTDIEIDDVLNDILSQRSDELRQSFRMLDSSEEEDEA